MKSEEEHAPAHASNPEKVGDGANAIAHDRRKPSIEFERVGLRYGRGEEILRDVSFSLPRGSFNFLTGPSGAGKTSVLRLAYLDQKPSRGMISLFGHDTSVLGRAAVPKFRRRMGIVLQEFQLIDHLTVYENVSLPLRVAGKGQDFYHKDVLSLLDWVGLGKKVRARPPTLSGGEKQRAAIARAVIAKPEILIADEPTGNVDHALGQRLMHLFAELNRLGTTMIIATHDVSLIPMGANIYSIENGQISAGAALEGSRRSYGRRP